MDGHRISVATIATGRFWQIAALTAAGAIGSASQAEAALYYWGYSEPGYYRPGPTVQPRRQRPRRQTTAKPAAEKQAVAKPVGPLIIAISIEKQKVRVYDANGFFAESPVSTGMKGHPTPMGVFSIIQKHKLHHSNIYSGAPMPFMQRITWSGVAMHAGVLPGYPASHGCIRMPMAFAQKMWNWTRMGARVVVTPGEMTPASFSHPLLVTQKVVPVANDAPQVDAPLGVKSDKGADARPASKPVDTAETKLELRSTVGHGQLTQTADASSAMPANAAVTMSDATSADEAAPAKATEGFVTEAKPEAAKSDEAKPETARSEAGPESAKTADSAASEDKPADAKPADIVTGEVKTDEQTAESRIEAPAEAQPETTAGVAKTEPPKAETIKAEEPKATEKPAEPARSVADAPATAPDVKTDEVKKDPARLPTIEKAAKAEPKREGQIAVFISRKDGKLYVRQNFKPVFDVPVTIAPSDSLLGTHLFTAEADKSDSNRLRWSVVSLPVSARNAQKNDDERISRRRKVAGAAPAEVNLPAPNSPAEALDRITIPTDAMARIAEALTTGGSIVVSDLSIKQGETGEGTDFIVPLR
ncbi:L,D-transpeptidase family protein [Bradyrhizobium sediminis]|uniref:L,D-transpeptidase family protein n=1 Tax=Bradyrhizobium sediminis TaxID=2840469 RepID=A0A975NVN0_9BRAD|nr:L,D-transpeptidase [Bradyrhizobium sediminis]QWG21501.1 L,D-transpeptidase family protein [Bradyrhizobium sediminis]